MVGGQFPFIFQLIHFIVSYLHFVQKKIQVRLPYYLYYYILEELWLYGGVSSIHIIPSTSWRTEEWKSEKKRDITQSKMWCNNLQENHEYFFFSLCIVCILCAVILLTSYNIIFFSKYIYGAHTRFLFTTDASLSCQCPFLSVPACLFLLLLPCICQLGFFYFEEKKERNAKVGKKESPFL